jgi:hypothetical protein
LDMRDELSVFQNLENPNRWSGPFRGSPARWKQSDGVAVLRALREAEADPVERRLGRLRATIKSAGAAVATDEGVITIPEDDEDEVTTPVAGSTHTEVQYRLLKLGADMGFDVHVARNDQGRVWNGLRLGDVPRRREELPQPVTRVTAGSGRNWDRTSDLPLVRRVLFR